MLEFVKSSRKKSDSKKKKKNISAHQQKKNSSNRGHNSCPYDEDCSETESSTTITSKNHSKNAGNSDGPGNFKGRDFRF